MVSLSCLSILLFWWKGKSSGAQKTWKFEWKAMSENVSQLAFTCSKLTIEALKQGVKYVQS